MKNTKSNIFFLRLSSFILSITPILMIIGFNFEDYTVTIVETIKLSVGLVIAIIFILLKCMGRLKIPEKRIFIYFIIFVMTFLLESILKDLLLFSAGALVGELLALPFEVKIKVMQKAIYIDETADATAKAIDSKLESIVQKYTSNGRV